MSAQPLAGVRVLDFTHVLAGPACARVLVDLGADVLRIEGSSRPASPWRASDEPALGRSLPYLLIHRGKRAMTIDLKSEAGVELARRLGDVADVVVENFSAGVMSKLGICYEQLSAKNPRLIFLSMSGYGHDGPRRGWRSMNANLQAYSGMMTATGIGDEPPVSVTNSWMDYIGALHGAFAIVDALGKRAKSGVGRYIDLAQFEAGVSTLGPTLLAGIADRRNPGRLGNRSPSAAPQGVYRCNGTDNWCVISVESDEQWPSFVAAIGSPEWAVGPRFVTLAGRQAGHDKLDMHIEGWTATRSAVDVERLLRAAGVTAQHMVRVDEILEEVGKDGPFHFEQGPRGPVLHTGLPFSFVPREPKRFGGAPTQGEHNQSAVAEWLGLDRAAIANYEAKGAFA